MELDYYAALIDRLSHVSGELAALYPQIAEALAQIRFDKEFEFKHVERLSTVGTLTATIGHEIKNSLAAALLYSENALVAIDDANLLRESLTSATAAIRRCQSIVQNVLRYAKNGSFEKGPHDLNQVVCRAVEMTNQYLAEHKAVIDVELADDLPRVTVNAIEIEQVLVNLIRNAVQESDCTGITISTENMQDAVRVRVRDDGRGIPKADLKRIFDPFFSGQDSSESAGLGLAISRRIIEDHQGTIDVESQAGQGSTFTVTLPLNPAKPDAAPSNSLDTEENRGSN